MKKLLTIALAFVLTGCGALAPAATPTAAPSSTPVVLVQTVEVTVIPTQQPTEVPTDTPAPTQTPQIIVVTATGGAAAAGPTNTAEANASTSGITPTATLPADVGGGMFTNFTRSDDKFSLRCQSQPDTITFGVSTSNELVTQVDFYYRIEDRLSISISGWVNAGKMVSDKRGNFTVDFKSLQVDPDLRSHKAWFDYEFVGINHLGAAIGRSGKVVKQITYFIDCTDY